MGEKQPKLVLSDLENEVLSDIREGREVSREALQKLLEKHPTLAGPAGDLAQLAEDSVVSMAAGGVPLLEESMRRWLGDMRKSLEKPGDGELERLLIHRVAISWLAVNSAEQCRAGRWSKGIAFADATFWDRHVSRLAADFQRACRTLAEVRRLGRPAVLAQMNIADKQQINITAAPQPIEAADAE